MVARVPEAAQAIVILVLDLDIDAGGIEEQKIDLEVEE